MANVNRITVLAVGLIGGSLAKALRAKGFANEIVGWGRNEQTLQRAVELGVIDSYQLDLAKAVAGSDIIVIATPTLIAVDMLQQLASLVPESTIITDVASVKGNLLIAAKEFFGKVPPNLVLGHPIAGSEKSGVEAVNEKLFINHRVILTPSEETSISAISTVTDMWQVAGADVVTMPVDEHDEVLAATSHLPHVLAYALVDALAGQKEQQNIFNFAAGGFRDFTRIASSDPKMWHDIALANDKALLKMIDLFSAQLNNLRDAIATADSESITECFTRAKAARDHFSDVLSKQQLGTITDE
ncbi:prephenate dehydrogenase/arogenate dehydrogenase family protein [Dasania marina]|uniref:prephenate dehydrogenase/arogenate dehydrogenase family protein n=1 Tax=Dasania marina TaxID=471499 RepID=UPI0030D74F48|tara:strand:- start:78 stop:980 length:903 start_codon:yes stop_codon:yes gene_type:complete